MSPENREPINQVFEQLLPVFQERLKGKKLIAFDFDGTLTPKKNPEFDEAIQTALAQAGADFLCGQVKTVGVMAFKKEIRERYLRGESITNFFQTLGMPRTFISQAASRVEKWRYLKEDPRLMPMMKTLKEKHQLVLASNSPRMENLLALKALGVEPEVFEFLICLEDVARSKPYPDSFQKIVELSGLSVEECVFVGDSLEKDIRRAKALGTVEEMEAMDGILVGEISDEATAWLPDIYSLSRLFVGERFQVVYVGGESGLHYPHIRDTQEKKS
jgi:HAD superfamily hydrolase (TIGR01549 family)